MEIIIELTQGDILQLHMTITYNRESTDYILDLFFSPKFHDRSKHNDIKYHFLCEKVNNQILQLEFIGPKPKHQACVATHGLIGFNELMGVRLDVVTIIKSLK